MRALGAGIGCCSSVATCSHASMTARARDGQGKAQVLPGPTAQPGAERGVSRDLGPVVLSIRVHGGPGLAVGALCGDGVQPSASCSASTCAPVSADSAVVAHRTVTRVLAPLAARSCSSAAVQDGHAHWSVGAACTRPCCSRQCAWKVRWQQLHLWSVGQVTCCAFAPREDAAHRFGGRPTSLVFHGGAIDYPCAGAIQKLVPAGNTRGQQVARRARYRCGAMCQAAHQRLYVAGGVLHCQGGAAHAAQRDILPHHSSR
mmetsp:Transcript_21626/g.55063  ORF Transcript_21626/g.55063 Transcript_21626/m.55063 type:complete len:259 (+) Transcript_21626:407-1183(+)